MLKNTFLQLVFLFVFASVFGQYGSQQIISTNADLAFRSIPFDVDNDGFIDVISASTLDSKIAWYRNLDGQGTFGSEQIISTSATAILLMELHDIDGDGDKDILYATNLDKIAWLENLNGLGSFGTERIIASNDYAYNVKAVDMDGDNDLDIVAILFIDSFQERLIWYENIDGLGNYGPEIHIMTEFISAGSLTITDIDTNATLDIVLAYPFMGGPDKIVWLSNNGSGVFAEEELIYQFPFSISDWTEVREIVPTDINGDAQIDLLVTTQHDNVEDTIAWLENLDNAGNYNNPIIIYNELGFSIRMESHDLDNDGDQDLLLADSSEDEIAWLENLNGQGNFSSKIIISSAVDSPRHASAADLNGDGDLDVISASGFDDKIAWYEYGGILGVAESTKQQFILYPNPTDGKVYINTDTELSTIAVYDVSGKRIEALYLDGEIDFSSYETGVYFVTITSAEGAAETVILIKE